MAHDFDRNAQLHRIAEVQKRIEQVEADIIAQNEIIAALEGRGRDAREARPPGLNYGSPRKATSPR
jgi:hypothetical protein